MKGFFTIITLFLLVGCAHHDPQPTSVEGKWSYTSSDKKISVTFDFVKNLGGLISIRNMTMTAEEKTGNCMGSITDMRSATFIGNVEIYANDSKLVNNYVINFKNGAVKYDFKSITFSAVSYTCPMGTDVNLTNVIVTRVQ